MNNEFNELVSDFETKLQSYQNLPVQAAISMVTHLEMLALMRDLLSIFKAMQ